MSHEEKKKRASTLHPLSIATLSQQQLRLILYHCARLLVELFSGNAFVSQVAIALEDKSNNLATLLQLFVQECLTSLTTAGNCIEEQAAAAAADKFWKALMIKFSELLEKVIPKNSVLRAIYIIKATCICYHDFRSI